MKFPRLHSPKNWAAVRSGNCGPLLPAITSGRKEAVTREGPGIGTRADREVPGAGTTTEDLVKVGERTTEANQLPAPKEVPSRKVVSGLKKVPGPKEVPGKKDGPRRSVNRGLKAMTSRNPTRGNSRHLPPQVPSIE